jgi:alanine-glyoxylate transaminase/serine-glyoxylate transaminase/serine-pyruvate transaminase
MPGPRMPGRNFLFVPGPTNVPDRVMRAMMVAMEDHRSSKFPELTLSLFQELKKIFRTENGQVFIFPSSGTGAWEAALSNTLSPGDKVLAPTPTLRPAPRPQDRCAERDQSRGG